MKYVWVVEDKEYKFVKLFSSRKKAERYLDIMMDENLEMYKQKVL